MLPARTSSGLCRNTCGVTCMFQTTFVRQTRFVFCLSAVIPENRFWAGLRRCHTSMSRVRVTSMFHHTYPTHTHTETEEGRWCFFHCSACTGQDGKCKHVYKKQDNDTHCPSCGHARNPKPSLKVFYFPIRDKLRALLKLPTYRKMIDFEITRSKNSAYLSDVYDSPAWQRFMGPCVIPNNRIGLQLCMDGIPAFSANTLSLSSPQSSWSCRCHRLFGTSHSS